MSVPPNCQSSFVVYRLVVAQTTGDNIADFKIPSMGEMENFWKILNFYFQLEILDGKITHVNRQRQNSPSFSYCLNYSKKGRRINAAMPYNKSS